MSACLNLATIVWCGPSSPKAIQADFEDWIRRELIEDGGVFFKAGIKDIKDTMKDLAKSHRYEIEPTSTTMRDDLARFTTQSNARILEKYDLLYASAEEGKNFFCNIEQNPGMAGHGKLFPTLDTHAKVWSMRDDRLATISELLSSQGVDCLPELWGDRGRSVLGSIIRQLPYHAASHLIGNSVHIPIVAAWQLYVLSHCKRPKEFYKVSLPLSTRTEDDEEEDVDA